MDITKFFYGVINIPSGISTGPNGGCFTDHTPVGGPNGSVCGSNQWNNYYKHNDVEPDEWYCVPLVYNAGSTSCTATFSMYWQLGGDPSNNPGQNQYNLIPSIGGNFPINLSSSQQLSTGLNNSYATGTWGTAFAAYNTSTNGPSLPGTQVPSIVVAYDITWFKSVEDLIAINPATTKFGNVNGATYTLQLDGFNSGSTIPSIEQQFYNIVAPIVCGNISTRCNQGTLNATNGWPFCSNFYDITPNNPCVNILTAAESYGGPAISPTGPTGPTGPSPPSNGTPDAIIAYQNAVNNYCSNFTNTNIPPECQCVLREQIPDYNAFYTQFDKSPTGVPPDKCWWRPCKDPTLALVPIGTINPGQSCPNICSQVVNILNNTNMGNVNISQELSCCGPGSTPKNCILSNNCPSNTQQNSDGTCVPISNQTFWDKYKVWIIVGIIIVVIIIIAIIVAIVVNSKKKSAAK